MGEERKSIHMLREGTTLKSNTFCTPKGYYTVRIVFYRGNLYFHKMLNGNVVEIINLNDLCKRQNK